MGDCLLWEVTLKITEIAHTYVLLFSLLMLCINVGKNVLGYILGDFSTNSSGHPANGSPLKTPPTLAGFER
jgi:hypothetical protein